MKSNMTFIKIDMCIDIDVILFKMVETFITAMKLLLDMQIAVQNVVIHSRTIDVMFRRYTIYQWRYLAE